MVFGIDSSQLALKCMNIFHSSHRANCGFDLDLEEGKAASQRRMGERDDAASDDGYRSVDVTTQRCRMSHNVFIPKLSVIISENSVIGARVVIP
jgi:hypothetical protein